VTRLLLINPNTDAATTARMAEIARGAIAGVTIETATARSGARLITNPAQLAAAALAVDALLDDAALDGIDGVIIAAFGDPGLAELRRRLSIPVTGIAEAAMAKAAEGDRRFSVATTTPELADGIRAAADAYGHRKLLISIRATIEDPAALMADERRLVEALAAACDSALRVDGAQAVVIGGGPLAQAARVLRDRFAEPIIEPLPAAVGLALLRAQSRPLGR